MKLEESNYGAIQVGEPPDSGNLQEHLQPPAVSVERRTTRLIFAAIVGLVGGITFAVLLYVRMNSLNLLNGPSEQPIWAIAMTIITAAWTFLYSFAFAIAARARYRRLLTGAAVLAVAIYIGVYGYVFFVEPDLAELWCFAVVFGPGLALGFCMIFGMSLMRAGAWIGRLRNNLTGAAVQVSEEEQTRTAQVFVKR